MSDGTAREMTLGEWVERLPKTHRARREYELITAEVALLRAEIESNVREEIAHYLEVTNPWIDVCRKIRMGETK